MEKINIEKIFGEKFFDGFARLKHWALKGGLAILDQGLFSGSNFVTSILLAKWLSNKSFGEFAVGLASITIFLQIYTSFALEPMSVLGPSEYRDDLIPYLIGQVKLLFFLSIPLAALSGIIVFVIQFLNIDSDVSSISLFSLIGLPFILFPLLMRRIFYVLLRPGFALAGSAFYFLGLLLTLYYAKQLGVLSGINSIFIVSAVSFFSGLIMFLFLWNGKSSYKKIKLMTILIETWSFGKWLVSSGVFIGLATQSQVYLAGILSSPEDAGVVRILQTFIQPMMLTFTAFSVLATPVIVNDFVLKDYPSMKRKVLLFTLILSGAALVYECLLVLFGGVLNSALFGGKYSDYADQIMIWGSIPVIWALFWGGVIALQTVKKPHVMVIISGAWAFFSLISGLILIPALGVWGATISIIAGYVAALLSTWVLYWAMVHRKYSFTGK